MEPSAVGPSNDELPPIEQPVEEEEESESEYKGKPTSAPDELVVINLDKAETVEGVESQMKEKEPQLSLEEEEEAEILYQEKRNQFDIWFPFVDTGIMHSGYYPPSPALYGFRLGGNHCLPTPISSALTSSYPIESTIPFPILRRSYFYPSRRQDTIPIHIRSSHPYFAPSFAYRYDRIGIQSSPPAVLPEKRIREVPPVDRTGIQEELSERTNAVAVGRAFSTMGNITIFQNQQIEYLTVSLEVSLL